MVAAVSLEPYEEAAARRRGRIGRALADRPRRRRAGDAVRSWRTRCGRWPDMTASARAWSDRDLDERFGFGQPYDELTELAATLDQLLDRNAAALRREQRLTAEISHELRTPLARITTEAELALRRNAHARRSTAPRWTWSSRTRGRWRGSSTRCWRPPAPAPDATQESAWAIEAARSARPMRPRRWPVPTASSSRSMQCARDAQVAANLELTTQILQPVVDNACRHARTRATIGIDRADGRSSSRSGTTARESAPRTLQRIFLPGVRGRGHAATGRARASVWHWRAGWRSRSAARSRRLRGRPARSPCGSPRAPETHRGPGSGDPGPAVSPAAALLRGRRAPEMGTDRSRAPGSTPTELHREPDSDLTTCTPSRGRGSAAGRHAPIF